jgi:hypothetical protein
MDDLVQHVLLPVLTARREGRIRRFVELMHGRDPEPLVEPACPSRRVRP